MTRHYCSPVCQASHKRLRPQATPAKQGWTRGEIVKGVLGGLALALVYVAIPWTVYLWMVKP